ncbi:MAG: T9SS type A sorting domain-containing protein, partial [Flavihumibacter sp.]
QGLTEANHLLITDAGGRPVFQAQNYSNNKNLWKLSPGIYFYQLRLHDAKTGYRIYSGKLMVTD